MRRLTQVHVLLIKVVQCEGRTTKYRSVTKFGTVPSHTLIECYATYDEEAKEATRTSSRMRMQEQGVRKARSKEKKTLPHILEKKHTYMYIQNYL